LTKDALKAQLNNLTAGKRRGASTEYKQPLIRFVEYT